jgi:hypothetical protein
MIHEDALHLIAAQTAANRRNAAKSTGPKTDTGKAIASQNARKHGLRSQHPIAMDPEDQRAFEEYKASMIESLEPDDEIQRTLVDRIAENAWRLRRILDVETAMIEYNVSEGKSLYLGFTFRGDIDRFMTLSKYERNIEKGFYQAMNSFMALKKMPRPTKGL